MREGLVGLLEVNQSAPQADLSVLEMRVNLDGARKVIDGPLRLAPPTEYLPYLVFRTRVSRVQCYGLPELFQCVVPGLLTLRGLQHQSPAQPIVNPRHAGVSFDNLSVFDDRQIVMLLCLEGFREGHPFPGRLRRDLREPRHGLKSSLPVQV